jgi:PAS domain S-box-containing protein
MNVDMETQLIEGERPVRNLEKTLTEREPATDQLADRQSALKELADQKFALDQHAIVAITDVQGTITYVNDKFCAISQYSREQLIGQNHRILNSGHHPQEFFQQMYHTIANGKVWHGEIKNRAKDGSIYWVDTTIVPSLTAEGKPRQYVAIRADITERKRAESALKESLATSDRALKELADQKFALDQHAIVAVTDVQGTITYVNDKFCAISQYPKEDLIGQNHRILNSGHHPQEFFQQMYHTIANGKVWHGEIKNRAKDGSIYWVDTTIVPALSTEGKPRQYVAIRADITERKRAEEALHETQERFRLLLDGVKDYAIYMLDPEGHVISWNEGAARLKGYRNEEILGKHFSCFYVPEDREADKPARQLRESLANGRFEEQAQRVRKDGSAFWANVVITPMYDDHGNHRGFSKVARDITQTRADEREIRKLNDELERRVEERTAQLETANKELTDHKFALDQHAIVAMTDVQGTITYVNDKFCSVSRYSREELIGQNHRIMNSGHHPREFFQEMYETIGDGEVWQGEMKNRAKDGSFYWLDTTIVPFAGSEGKPRQYATIRADITKRKQAEERVQQRTVELETANKELEAFSYSVSHDLRAPLRHISGFSKLLVEEFGSALDPAAQHYLERIQSGTQKMGLLVDELLNLARVGRHVLHPQRAGLNSIVAEVIAILQPDNEGRQVQWMIAELPEVDCDPVLVKQIFQNLLANALKFTRPRAQSVIEVSCQKKEEDGQPVFMVRDNGIGFNMKYVDKLFGVFQRLHRPEDFEGTGIGLVTVQRIVHKHGGRVWAEGEVDKGAAFYFTLGAGKQAGSKSNAAIAGGQS